jgi:photosystem II stability/assembly factor-like uncharacterized protein
MTNLRSIAICSAIVLLSFGNARAHVPHDIIYSLDVSPTFADDGLVFSSSTQFGAAHLRSSKYGETFSESHAGMHRTLVTGHTFSPDFGRDGTIFMATQAGYYKSTDRGSNWKKQSLFANEEVFSICIAADYSETETIYVLTKNGVHRVDDAANANTLKDFNKTTFGKLQLAGDRLFVHRVFYDMPKKKNGMELVDYATGTVDVLNLATDKWSTLADQFDSAVIADFDTSSDGTTAVVSLKDGSVQLSNNSGRSWKEVFKRSGDFFCKVKLSPNYAEDQTIACGSAKGYFFLSEDGGQKWETRSNGLSRWVHHVNILINKIVFSPSYASDKTIFLGKTTGFYKTTDAGKYWRHINVWNTKWSYFVYAAPGKDSQDIFTATYNSGISRSSDHGDTWHSANIGITSAFANGMLLSPNHMEDKSIFVLDIATGLYRSSDGGRSWTPVAETDTAKVVGKPVLYRKLGISPEFKDDGLIYFFSVPRKILGDTEKHSWKFNDKTKELTLLSIGGDKNYINGFSFTPKGSKQKQVFAATARGAFVSADEGKSWENMTPGRGAEKIIVSPDYENDGLLYLMDKTGSLRVTNDFGATFQPADLNLDGKYIGNLTFSPDFANDRTMYVNTFGEGVFRSRDAGNSWSNLGLKGKLLFSGPTFSSNYTEDRTLFAPAIDGVFRSTDDGATWKNILNRTEYLPKEPQLVLRDPTGHEVPLTFGVPAEMKRYKMYDEEVGLEMFRTIPRSVRKLKDSRAYLASYYKFGMPPRSAVEISFYGTAIEYKCVTSGDLGIVEIELDGKPMGEFDLYSEQDRFDVTGFAKSDLKPGFHRLRIVATGQKNPASSGAAMSFNAATVEN